jgi:hypothetical protein
VPAKDYEVEKQCYKDIGFQIGWSLDEICVVKTSKYNFDPQDYYVWIPIIL